MIRDEYAVFGHPINHSKSPAIHAWFAQQTGQVLDYTAQDVPADAFTASVDSFFASGGKGLNCTVPLKELACRYADQLTARADLAGAVNTLLRDAEGRIVGDNTDGVGLVTDLQLNQGLILADQRILVLGAGGASRGIIAPLLACLPAELLIVNRTMEKADALLKAFSGLGPVASSDYAGLAGRQFDLIINATSASLSAQLPPLPAQLLAEGGSCYDLAYANQATAFVTWGLVNRAVKSLDGLGMLVEQAAEAFYLWRGVRPSTAGLIAEMNRQRQTNV